MLGSFQVIQRATPKAVGWRQNKARSLRTYCEANCDTDYYDGKGHLPLAQS